VQAGRQARIECRALQSRPAGELVWLRDGQVIVGGVHMSSEPASPNDDRLVNTVATLVWNASVADTNRLFTCVARHVAFGDERVLRTNFTMNVLCRFTISFQRVYLLIDLQIHQRNHN
jgi:hypothetical protein